MALTSMLKKGKAITKNPDIIIPHGSPSSLGNFLSCRRKAYWHLVRRLTMKKGRLSLEVGTMWHSGLDTWYAKKKIMPARRAIYKEMDKIIATGYSSLDSPWNIAFTRSMLNGMLFGYIDRYGKKDLKTWKWLATEKQFEILNFMGSGISFTGRIDGVIEILRGSNKGIWIVEHKTTKDLSYFSVESIKNSLQTLGYIKAAKEIYGIEPKGIIWNAVRKPSKRLKKNQTNKEYCDEIREDYEARPDFYFYREQLIIPKKSIRAWESEIAMVFLDLAFCFENPDDLDIWYKNTSVCDMYGGCEFCALCNRGEKRSSLALYRKIEHE